MRFRYIYVVENLRRDGRLAEPWDITFKCKANKKVICRHLSEEEVQRRARQRGGLYIEASANFRIRQKNDNVLLCLEERRVPQDIPTDAETQQQLRSKIGSDGLLKNEVLPLSLMPDYYQDFQHSITEQLRAAARDGFRLLRWRLNMDGYRSSFLSRGLQYSRDNDKWIMAPHTLALSLSVGPPRPVMSDEIRMKIRSDLEALVSTGKKEPICYELFYEAWNQCRDNPRSSLVIGIAALEAALKQCITQSCPNTEWLLMNMQSPSVERMLRGFASIFRTITPKVNGEKVIIPASIIAVVVKGVNMRNRIVHGHDQEVDARDLHELLLTVHDLMRIFDTLCGERWAMEYVRPQITSQLARSDAARGRKGA
jgi:hypothetical protein